MSKLKIINALKKYSTEFLLIFISVILAFALTEWSNNQGKKVSQKKILLEISNGLKIDYDDAKGNAESHEYGVKACKFWRKVILDQDVDKDSVLINYFLLTRTLISLQNTTAYETLKLKGLETIENDSLRLKIIHLYEVNYELMRKFEEDYQENQFFDNYFFEINKKIAPYLKFDNSGNIIGLNTPLKLTNDEKNILLSYLWKIQVSRTERSEANEILAKNINKLKELIDMELNNNK